MESGKIKADYTGIHISNKNRVTKRGKNDKNEERRTRNAPASAQERVLSALYDHALGRCLLRPMVLKSGRSDAEYAPFRICGSPLCPCESD